ncbi:hypothetical protein VTJ49DRAFT_759 [Mycothermus thermophilus]|uniref:C2H2-type domain-containing protein n=1 Tax=Humicola insolens TaxID=85995 RepID=A0ABR3VE54_HUMIN
MPPLADSVSPGSVEPEPKRDPGQRETSDDKDIEGLDLDDADDGDGGGDGAHSSNSDGPARKRRRSRKGLDKKFECPEKGCGKSYSRAEHLYRHQLNHNPKQVYKCGIGDCQRTFVRLDLCNRHKDRHQAKGSALNRKDSLLSQTSPVTDTRPPFASPGSASPEVNRPGTAYTKGRSLSIQYHSPKDVMGSPYTPVSNTPPTTYANGAAANGVDYVHHDQGGFVHMAQRGAHQSPDLRRASIQSNVGPYGVLSPVSTQHGFPGQPHNTPHSAGGMAYVPPQNFPPFSLPPSDFAASSSAAATARNDQASYSASTGGEFTDQQAQSAGEMMLLDQMGMQQTMPVFGSDSILNKSPYVAIPEDFVAYLFNTHGENSPLTGVPMQSYNYGEFSNQYGAAYYGNDPSQMGYFPAVTGPQQVMSVTSLLDQNLPESVISEEKSAEIFELIKERFHENGHAPVERQRDTILEGDRNDDSHMLSRKMMQAYIGSYWVHFSDQVPILHKPTFSPDKTPNLLLIAIMTIGAACLDKAHGAKVTKAGAQLSNFLAWHLRWEMFQDPNCRPPAKLWVFQTLLLLELYEKMYSTRELHERAHIHHATTITLMRRGRALIGKSALDSPPNPRDDKTNGSRQSSTSGAMTPEEWWNNWVTNESTRRAAFAAFVIDSIHATMFGHSTVMVAHEMRLPLPCDDKLWKATSGPEVARIESQLMAGGNKAISFLEGLKRTLSNQEVQTNSFGRTILMAGLLSVSWHMNQRDLQVNSLGGGVSQALGGRDKWRGTLTRAFDSWKSDFDKTLLRRGDLSSDPYYDPQQSRQEENVVFESRIVLHHLAHMAMHVDIVDCQIFARAKRLLGRAIGPQDLNSAQRRMKDIWAPSAKARDATYYALKFLQSVLMPDVAGSTVGGSSTGAANSAGYGRDDQPPYSARDDVLLNRPWVLYFAALVVWCYGFALEGPCPGAPVPTTQQEKVRLMREYLLRYGSVSSPEELKAMKGISQNTAVLMVLKDAFSESRWELLHEGATLMNNCIQLNAGHGVP